ncbi:Protein of unknown function DUF2344 [Syntrophobotulus glycolicus DSM 8271]|uniref:DUF2344 domain-containing protein n=1 Tax=Syntrophobotulus glycolicus (strain DSM 8271 / FlGlyR) TaxID=645991 RepID=F0SVH4_SYNGF|nr:TIGR03936 family radical SAM-associated protein [Syntrophobotulus glycolicus]ADY56747.1 Protein of unknown function DUF2344 [Syntrophobotulus glycolicus DSM 8271]
MRLRMAYAKKNQTKYIAHLDLTRVFDRALRRAGIKAAYSEGFNPHPKIAFGAPLPVGVEGEREYVDIEIREDLMAEQDPAAIIKLLQEQLPAGIRIIEGAMMPAHPKALMAVINVARYQVEVPFLRELGREEIELFLDRWLARGTVLHKRRQRDKIVEKDIRHYVLAARVLEAAGNACTLRLEMKIGNEGTARPGDILDSLVLLEEFPIDRDGVMTVREGLFVRKEEILLTPIEDALQAGRKECPDCSDWSKNQA